MSDAVVFMVLLLTAISVVASSVGVFFFLSGSAGKHKSKKNSMCSLLILLTVLALYINWSSQQRDKESLKNQQALVVWQSAGCPVYRAQCGSYKYPYACEKKAAVIGRNQVDNVIVIAYGICVK